jgi:hypothetical protein
MEPNGPLTRRRFVTLTAITGASLALAGCGADQPSGETETESEAATETPTPTPTPTATPTATATHQQDQPATEQDHNEMEPGSHPLTTDQLDVRKTFSNGYPTWIDQNGRMYGRGGHEVMVSDDWWHTTEVLYSFQGHDDGNIKTVIVPDSGHVLVAVGGHGEVGGRIYRIHDNLTGAEQLYQFEYGRVPASLNHVAYKDIVLLASYGLSDYQEGQYANEVILSTDGGQSFDRILEVPLKTKDAANLHIHDVEYDPYADRIWVTVGDNGNSQLYWSDDRGSSWETIATQGEVTMMTQIAAFKDCVCFGTDGVPEGIIRWEREGPNDAPTGVDDLVRPYVKIKTDPTDDTMEMYARHRWHIREDDGRELCLMPFGYSPMDTGTDSVVLASVDGAKWYELYRTDTRDILLTNVIGPLSMDGPRRTIVSDSTQQDGYQIDATVPKFWD